MLSKILARVWIYFASLILPAILTHVSNYVEKGLMLVVDAENQTGEEWTNERRRIFVLAQLTEKYPRIPNLIHRFNLELCLVLNRLGVTWEVVNGTEQYIVTLLGAYPALRDIELIRDDVVDHLAKQYPDLKERAARLLTEFFIAKLFGLKSDLS